jgi:hypothetical protein
MRGEIHQQDRVVGNHRHVHEYGLRKTAFVRSVSDDPAKAKAAIKGRYESLKRRNKVAAAIGPSQPPTPNVI